MIKSIIVEDDPKHSQKLSKLLKQIKHPIDIIAVSTTIESACRDIIKLKPVLVFLDIDLDGDETGGFSVLKQLENIDFEVIFTTAHIDKNITEIRACGLDYVAKPYILGEIDDAIEKYIKKKNGLGSQQADSLRQNLITELISEKVIWIPNNNEYIAYAVKHIIYCKADNQYTYFYINGVPKPVTSSKGIGEWEKDLEKYNFCRIHKSSIVNRIHILKYVKGDGGEVIMSGDIKLDISKTYKQAFLRFSEIR